MKEWAKIQDTNSVSEEKLPDRISYNASKISKEMSWKVHMSKKISIVLKAKNWFWKTYMCFLNRSLFYKISALITALIIK